MVERGGVGVSHDGLVSAVVVTYILIAKVMGFHIVAVAQPNGGVQ